DSGGFRVAAGALPTRRDAHRCSQRRAVQGALGRRNPAPVQRPQALQQKRGPLFHQHHRAGPRDGVRTRRSPMKPLRAEELTLKPAPSRLPPYALDGLIIVVSIVALYLCAVVMPSALDNTIVYKGF